MELTVMESSLLYFLGSQAQQTFTREILASVCESSEAPRDVHVMAIREGLGPFRSL